jgi:hypothetical protein
MPKWLLGVAIALIGLAGTLIVAYIGYRQWRVNRRDSTRQEYIKTRRQTYETLWKLVEKIHVELRRYPDELRNLNNKIAEVNSYVLENELYLAKGDHELVDKYLEALGEMISWAQREGDPTILIPLGDTAASLPYEATAIGRAFYLRDQIKDRFRKALQEL